MTGREVLGGATAWFLSVCPEMQQGQRRETRDERRETRDERRETRDERRETPDDGRRVVGRSGCCARGRTYTRRNKFQKLAEWLEVTRAFF